MLSFKGEDMKNKYTNFLMMILTSMAVMFGIKYLTTYEVSHVYWSQTRFYMLMVMGAAMAVVMLLFMQNMYQNKKANYAIIAISALVFSTFLYLTRTQNTIADQRWMEAMIPHHSIAILTSKRANIKDIRVQELANGIIKAQEKEIKEMQWLLDDIEKNGIVTNEQERIEREVPDFSEGQNILQRIQTTFLRRK